MIQFSELKDDKKGGVVTSEAEKGRLILNMWSRGVPLLTKCWYHDPFKKGIRRTEFLGTFLQILNLRPITGKYQTNLGWRTLYKAWPIVFKIVKVMKEKQRTMEKWSQIEDVQEDMTTACSVISRLGQCKSRKILRNMYNSHRPVNGVTPILGVSVIIWLCRTQDVNLGKQKTLCTIFVALLETRLFQNKIIPFKKY